MKMFKFLVVISAVFFVGHDCSARSDSGRGAMRQGDASMSVRISDGTVLTGIRQRNLRLSGTSVIRLIKSDGFKVLDASGRQSSSGLTWAQVVEALEKLIVQVQAGGERVDGVQVDLAAVSDLWAVVRSATKASVRKRSGPISQKDPEVSAAIRRSIRSSLFVRSVCQMAGRHRLRCDPRDSFVEQVVFESLNPEVRQGDVLASESAGLSLEMAMGLSLLPVEGASSHK